MPYKRKRSGKSDIMKNLQKKQQAYRARKEFEKNHPELYQDQDRFSDEMKYSNGLFSDPSASNDNIDIVEFSFEQYPESKLSLDTPQEFDVASDSSNVSNENSMDNVKDIDYVPPPDKTQRPKEIISEIDISSASGVNFVQVIRVYKKSCRLCLKDTKESPTCIWNYKNNFKESIFSLCGITVSKSELLTSLCTHCVEKLNDFVKFRMECIENNKIVEKILRNKHIAPRTHDSEDEEDPTTDVQFNVLYEKVSDTVIISKEVDPEREEYSFAVEPKDDDSEIENEQQIVFKNSEDYYTALEDKEITFEGSAVILECEKCPVSCEGQKEIEEHIDSHRGIKQLIYDCTMESCQRKFSSYNNLMNHLRNSHCEDVPPVNRKKLCQYCGKFVCGLSHIHHKEGKKRKINRNRKYVKCPKCDKMVINILNHKLKIHNPNTGRSCNVCGKKFADSYNLKSHMRTHTGEKPFSCPDCTELFRHNVTMKFHRLKLHNVNMFKRPAEEVLASLSKKQKRLRRENKIKSTELANEEQK